jgi:hypothetical protein
MFAIGEAKFLAVSLDPLPTWGCADLLRTKELSGGHFFSLVFFFQIHINKKKPIKTSTNNLQHHRQDV